MKKLTIENSGFKKDQKIEITGYELGLIKMALNDSFDALTDVRVVELYKYVDQDGEPVENVTIEDLKSGKTRQVVDIFNTFRPSNQRVEYSGKITPTMLEAQRQLFEIHTREAEAGRAVSIEELIAEANTPNLEVVKDA